MRLLDFLKDKWWLFVLVFIFLFSFYIRSVNITPDRLLSFDPIFQYRYTKYFVDWGTIPVWDELTYYVGRRADFTLTQPLMYYMTAFAYWIVSPLGLGLMTVAAYMSAIYGALITIPAFLLGRELSNKYGGLFAGFLMGTAPQILVRTFGSSYDTDQVVLFFLVLTLYLGYYALKKKTIPSFCLALAGFSAFMLAWNNFWYTFLIIVAAVLFNFVLNIIILIREKTSSPIVHAFKKIRSDLLILFLLAVCIFVVGILNNTNIVTTFFGLLGFAQQAEAWIVNISIAELQPFDIFNLQGWVLATGRFFLAGESLDALIINTLIILVFIAFLVFGIIRNFWKRNAMVASFLIVLFLMGIYTTFRGVRFTEFTSSIFIVLIGVGFGNFVDWTKRDTIINTFFLGLGIFVIFIALNIGLQMGAGLGPDNSPNWENAWTFLRTETPEFSIVGTWWDPGHMITGLAERRAYADGAHCESGFDGGNACLYTINDRITDLGKIMASTDENESLRLIRKYQGNSPNVYWIASDDLIAKFRWLQYFGTGCDGVFDQSCPLYIQIPESSRSVDDAGNVMFRNYAMNEFSKLVIYNAQIPIPMFVEGINIALFDEFIAYNGTTPIPVRFNEEELNFVINSLRPLEEQLSARFTNQTIQMTVWMPETFSYIVIIPPNHRNSVFTRMFMLEGQGLEHFRQVFRNEQVKIYEIV